MGHFNIAVDGPAGAGKSTIARMVAEKLGFVYVDTGAMYRTMALHFIRLGISPGDEEAIARACRDVDVTICYKDGAQQVGGMASATSVYAPVRKKLVELQQELARKTDVIMDGRDIGTCVLPDAPAKIYLTASVEVRAGRRFKELTEKGVGCTLKEIEEDIRERDYRDMNREHSPLRQAEDAVLLDSSGMTIEQVADAIIRIACERGLEVGA